MSDKYTNMRNEENVQFRVGSLKGLDTGWILELVGAAVAWFCDEPVIAIITLTGKGLLQHYQHYLAQLPRSCREQHITVCHTLLGSGLLTALPTMGTGQPFEWLVAALLGISLAWMILLTTGCMAGLRPRMASANAETVPTYA